MIPILLNPRWSGAIVHTQTPTIQSAYATVRVPTVTSAHRAGKEIADWVGVGGWHRPLNLCQAGISLGYSSTGQPQIGLIAQDYPSPPVGGVSVAPGNMIQIRVGHWGGHFAAEATDETTGRSLMVGCRVPYRGWHHAEWIVEKPAGTFLATTPVIFFHDGLTRSDRGPLHWARDTSMPWWPVIKRGSITVTIQ